jgi:hypothetical protein
MDASNSIRIFKIIRNFSLIATKSLICYAAPRPDTGRQVGLFLVARSSRCRFCDDGHLHGRSSTGASSCPKRITQIALNQITSGLVALFITCGASSHLGDPTRQETAAIRGRWVVVSCWKRRKEGGYGVLVQTEAPGPGAMQLARLPSAS